MKNENLKNLLNRLIEIEGTKSPLISCFVNLEQGLSSCLLDLEAQAQLVEKRLGGDRRRDFVDAFVGIRDYLKEDLEASSKSAALYSRWGESPVFAAAQFEVPMEPQFMVDDLPHIYPLIELKDTYHRFVIVITTEKEARILETTIGSVTGEVLKRRPTLRKRIGREWTREHYRNHRREREDQFIREKIGIIAELMDRRGHNYLIVAGSPNMVGRLTAALPRGLKDRLVSTVLANPNGGLDPILLESIQLFVAAENMESHHRVDELESAVLSGGLGVAGYDASLQALEGGYGDVLLVDQDDCETGLRENLIRLAVRQGIHVETVKRSQALKRLGGVGCLLRYRINPVPTGKVRLAS